MHTRRSGLIDRVMASLPMVDEEEQDPLALNARHLLISDPPHGDANAAEVALPIRPHVGRGAREGQLRRTRDLVRRREKSQTLAHRRSPRRGRVPYGSRGRK